MVGETLKPETVELFRKYREAHREVFLDEIDRFIWGANHTLQEHAEVRKVCVERGKGLRAPSGGKRGRPRGTTKESCPDGESSSLQQSDRNIAHAEQGVENELDKDWMEHGWFRTVCMFLGDVPANRPLFLREILLFILDADKRELALIRKRVAEYATVKRPKRGRPDVRTDDDIKAASLKVAWMRHVDGKKWREIAAAFPEYSPDDKFKTLRNLEDYAAAAIWRAMPPNCVRMSASGSEIAPGALESKTTQAYIRFHSGLPFTSHPKECKKIVMQLWKRGMGADWKLVSRRISRASEQPV